MAMFKLSTNEHPYGMIVDSTPERLREKMYEYIREKMSKGYKLSEVLYSWTPITVTKV